MLYHIKENQWNSKLWANSSISEGFYNYMYHLRADHSDKAKSISLNDTGELYISIYAVLVHVTHSSTNILRTFLLPSSPVFTLSQLKILVWTITAKLLSEQSSITKLLSEQLGISKFAKLIVVFAVDTAHLSRVSNIIGVALELSKIHGYQTGNKIQIFNHYKNTWGK